MKDTFEIDGEAMGLSVEDYAALTKPQLAQVIAQLKRALICIKKASLLAPFFVLLFIGAAIGQSVQNEPQQAFYGTREEIKSSTVKARLYIVPGSDTLTVNFFLYDPTDEDTEESDSVIVVGNARFKRLAPLSMGGSGGSSTWTTLPGKPSTFPPSSHTQAISTVVGLQDSLNTRQKTLSLGSVFQYRRGDNSLVTMNAAAVGLPNTANVDSRIADNLTSGSIPTGRFAVRTIPNTALAQAGATNGQVLKWSTSLNAWIPKNDSLGAGGSGSWGTIPGTIADQADLISLLNAKVPTTRNLTTGSGLAGGGSLSADRTISLATNGVSNSNLAQMSQRKLKGRGESAGTGDVTDIDMLDLPVSTAAQTAFNERVLTVANVAALKAITTAVNGQTARTRGYYTNSDGGENTYYWNSSSTAAKDSGFVFQANGVSTGRWIAVNRTTVNVLQFGVLRDGSTNNLARLTNATAALEKGDFIMPAGSYKVVGTWSISKNAANDTTQSCFIVKAFGAKIITSNATSTPVLTVYDTKRIKIEGLEVQGTIAVEGMWWSDWNNVTGDLVTFGKGDTDYFNQHYWNDFRSCRFKSIEIYTGAHGALSEFNANSFYNCNFRDAAYLIKLYGTELAQANNFYNCDFSNVGTRILYIDTGTYIKDAQLNFYGCYFDDYDANQGFPYDLKGVEVNFYGNSLAANISTDFDMKAASQIELNFAKGTVGNRLSTRFPTTTMNLIKNGDLAYGDAGFFVNGSLTKAMVTDTGYYNKVLRVTGNTNLDTYFESIPAPYTGTYSFVAIGKNTGGKTLTPFYQVNGVDSLYTPINFPATTYTASGFSLFLRKGDVFKIVWVTQNTTGNQFEISYVGLTYGKRALLGVMAHPLAEAAVNSASTTYDPASISSGVSATTSTITVTGAELGDFVNASFSNSLQGMLLTGYVSAANTVTCVFSNLTGSSVDLASGTLKVKIEKR